MFGGGAAYLLYEGAGFAVLQIADLLGYEGEIERLDPDQQKALSEASARALAYLMGEMVSNPLLACTFLLLTVLKDNARLKKKETVAENAESSEKSEGASPSEVQKGEAPKCCKNWAYRDGDMALVRERGYEPGQGHHPACRHFK